MHLFAEIVDKNQHEIDERTSPNERIGRVDQDALLGEEVPRTGREYGCYDRTEHQHHQGANDGPEGNDGQAES